MLAKSSDIMEYIPPYIGGDKHDFFNCNNGSYMLRISKTTRQEYDNYIKTLDQLGFTLYDSNCIRDNYHATYINNTVLVHAYFTSNDGVARIIVDPNTTLYKRKKDITYTRISETTLYQMELDYRNIDCGMCYITQCADGSFFIIDSAHMNSVNDHTRLYNLLRSLTPVDQEIMISGWFLSHAHQDHIAMFMNFLKADFKDCKIECLYYNFPALTIPGSDKWKEDDKVTIREFHELVENHREIPRVKLHTGQRFFIRNLEIEVLATHEDLYPQQVECFNDTSTVILMKIDGSNTLFLGDANIAECTIIVARYGSYVKSDIVQVAHHGYNGSNVGIYFCTDHKVALYSTRQSRYDESKSTESNKTIIEHSKEIYIAGNGTVAFKLPYTLGTAIVFPKEVNDL